jgi:hypothetical protein
VAGCEGIIYGTQLTIIIDYKKANEMNNFLLGSVFDPKTTDNGEDGEETLKDFDPNEESLTEGSEYMDDDLRMVEQPFHSNI